MRQPDQETGQFPFDDIFMQQVYFQNYMHDLFKFLKYFKAFYPNVVESSS